MLGEHVRRVRVGLAEDRHEDVSAVDLVLARRLHVGRRALEDALEAEGLLRRLVDARRQALDVLVEVAGHLALELGNVDRAGAQHLDHRGIVQQRVEDVLDRQVLVPAATRLAEGEGERRFEGPAEAHHASSTVQRSGNSCTRASRSVSATRVSAISRE